MLFAVYFNGYMDEEGDDDDWDDWGEPVMNGCTTSRKTVRFRSWVVC